MFFVYIQRLLLPNKQGRYYFLNDVTYLCSDGVTNHPSIVCFGPLNFDKFNDIETASYRGHSVFPESQWCRIRDSNSYTFRYMILNHTCLPFHQFGILGDPAGTRTRIAGVKGRPPRPVRGQGQIAMVYIYEKLHS